MARKPSERRHTEDEMEEVNLLPVMSILCILIPVLILAFNFFEVSIQQVAAPKVGKPKEADENKDKPLQLTVVIDSKGFSIKQNTELVTEKEKPIPKHDVQTEKGETKKDYNFAELYRRLREIKRNFPEERTVNISGDPKIPWHVVARTIDASRVQLEEDAFPDSESYSSAAVKLDDDKLPVAMFDTVVFAVTD
jgi:biopolymer transport protein ExbD